MTGFADPRGSQTVLRFLPPGPSLQKSHLTEFATMETGPDNVCIFTAPVAKSWLNSATADASPISKSVPEFQMLHELAGDTPASIALACCCPVNVQLTAISPMVVSALERLGPNHFQSATNSIPSLAPNQKHPSRGPRSRFSVNGGPPTTFYLELHLWTLCSPLRREATDVIPCARNSQRDRHRRAYRHAWRLASQTS